jgi:CubicO group peptidase (beta-lactamase class C family)
LKQGKYDISKPAPIWSGSKINVKNITTNDLLHMNSGLEWEENYSTICATTMLFQSGNMGRIQLEKTVAFAPNTHWNYSWDD